eukprot:scaffold792_cov84-Cylindrotheca_fusiformis.AAC.3
MPKGALNEESKDFRFESPPFVLRLLNKRDDENKRKLQDVLTDKSDAIIYFALFNKDLSNNKLELIGIYDQPVGGFSEGTAD